MAWHLVRTLDVEDVSRAKRTVDLLWSGGALTTTGNQADLEMIRRVLQLVPGLGRSGYSPKSHIAARNRWVDDVHLVCAENAHRLPPRLADLPHASMPNGAFRTETFGTRHDVAGTPVDRFIRLAELGGALESVQMISDMQVIKPGATLYTGLHLFVPTFGHIAAFAAAWNGADEPRRSGERAGCAPVPRPAPVRAHVRAHRRVRRRVERGGTAGGRP